MRMIEILKQFMDLDIDISNILFIENSKYGLNYNYIKDNGKYNPLEIELLLKTPNSGYIKKIDKGFDFVFIGLSSDEGKHEDDLDKKFLKKVNEEYQKMELRNFHIEDYI